MKASPEAQPKQNYFYQTHKKQIDELLRLAGIESRDMDIGSIVLATQDWVKGDHFTPKHSLELDSDSEADALSLFNELAMIDAQYPPKDIYDRVVILGGVHKSNESRVSFAKELFESGTVTIADGGKIIMLGGTRPVNKDTEVNIDGLDTETQSLRHLSEILGRGVLRQIHLRVGLIPIDDDLISKYVIDGDSSGIEIINSNPAIRNYGTHRHTTESTLKEWLDNDSVSPDSKILFVSSNPYIYRTSENLASVVHNLGYNPQINNCGPAALPNMLVRRCYGELARILYQEQ